MPDPNVENWREHYVDTLRQWLARLGTRREEALQVVDEYTYRAWQLYLAMIAYSFQAGWVNLFQVLFVKPEATGISGMPRTLDNW